MSTRPSPAIALSDAGQIALLPGIAAAFARQMPLAKLRALGIDSLLLLGGLPGPEVDMVIGPEAAGADIHTEQLFDQETVLICRAGHPSLGSRKRPAVAARSPAAGKASAGDRARAQAHSLRHIAIEMASGQGLRDMAGAAYAKAGIERNVVLTVPTFSAAAAVVAETDLVATVPASIVEAGRTPAAAANTAVSDS